jgi:GT2 family glycosyltransferase
MALDLGFVILSYNHHQLTSECVNSVLAIDPLAKIYLVHNGSDKKQVLLLQNQFQQINVIHIIIETNQGFSGGANQGLKTAFTSKNWLLFLTNDTLLAKLPEYLPSAPGQYAPQILLKRNKKVDSMGAALAPGTGHLFHIKDLNTFKKLKQESLQKMAHPLLKKNFLYIPGTAFLIDKKTFFLSGFGFDTNLGTYWEDVDFSIRLQKLGLNVDYCPELIVNHKVGKTCHKDSHYTTFLFHRNRLVISWKHACFFEKHLLGCIIIFDFFKRFYRDFKNKKMELFSLYFKALIQGIKMIKTNKQTP